MLLHQWPKLPLSTAILDMCINASIIQYDALIEMFSISAIASVMNQLILLMAEF